MLTSKQLVVHAERCADLARICTDQDVAQKLRQLARDYLDLANQPPERLWLPTDARL
jgi:hypothetical protein